MFSTFLFIALQTLTVNAGFQDNHALVPRQEPTQCVLIGELFDACSSLTPGIFTMPATVQAGCFCYDSTTWIADAFDSAIQTCASYVKTALPSDYPVIESYAGFCTSVGDFVNHPNGAAATTTPVLPAGSVSSASIPKTSPPGPSITSQVIKPAPTTASPNPATASVNIFTNPGCSFVSFALSFCNSATPGFSTLDVTSQAPCLCYSSTSWSPDGFDGPVQTCANFVSTAVPSAYSDIAAIEGYCNSIGDITTKDGNGGGTAAPTTSGGVLAIGLGGGGIGLTVPGAAKSTSTSTSSPADAPATTTKPTTAASAPTSVLTTSRTNSSLRLASTMFSLFAVAFSMAVLL
jgi:hypothetical protein